MTTDLAQFRQVFVEESLEGLAAMESGLLELDAGNTDMELINTIFRAAHSIKGGSGTFGFDNITALTHVLETLLDDFRSGHMKPDKSTITLLLQAVDCLREMMSAMQAGETADERASEQIRVQLQQCLAMGAGGADVPLEQAEPPGGSALGSGWHMHFRPQPHLMRSGNDPLRILRELAELGELTVKADVSALPQFSLLEPEDCLLAWDMTLLGAVGRETLDEVFAWVLDDADLVIEPLPGVHKPVDGSAPAAAEPALQSTLGAVPDPNAGDPSDPAERGKTQAVSGSIRVEISKLDSLINLVGELVITQSMLHELGSVECFDALAVQRLSDGLSELERNTRDIQESVMGVRMLPISYAFNRFPRMVRDLCQKMGKQVALKMVGEQTELDKTVLEKISDPLNHLARNAVDHGIETPEVRRAAGKPETGTLTLSAHQYGGSIVIEISDDGAGLNRERIMQKAVDRGLVRAGQELQDGDIYDLIFSPGFSTAETVTDVSGRGVGMDVVSKNVQALGGTIEIDSELGRGTTFRVVLPLSLAILDGQSINVGGEVYIVPLTAIMESAQVRPGDIRKLNGDGEVFRLRGDYLPLIRLHDFFGVGDRDAVLESGRGLTVVVEGGGKRVALLVDELLNQQQVVVKRLDTNFKAVPGFSGATILGDGSVALILDIIGMARMASQPDSKQRLPVSA